MPPTLRKNVGEVDITPAPISELEWRIPDFKSLPEKTGEYFRSPAFKYNGMSFISLDINPPNTVKAGSINLILITRPPIIKLEVSFALKTVNREKYRETNRTERLLFNESELYRINDFLFRTELIEKESELLPSGALTVLCTVKPVEDRNAASTSLCSNCKNSLDTESVSGHEKKCREKPIKCPECSEVVLSQDWYGHECQKDRTEEDEELYRDLKKMLSEGKNHDLILKIGEKELRAHRDVLRSRSHVFESMLNYDMKEKNSGIIDVPDCEPEAMEQFLLYLYTGKVETLDQNHMLGLYYIADKYDKQVLKKKCRNSMKNSLSHTNICDVIQLAVKHSDSGLLEYATEYFIENALEITVTVEWQSFLKDNTTLGNELFIKSFQKLKHVKS